MWTKGKERREQQRGGGGQKPIHQEGRLKAQLRGVLQQGAREEGNWCHRVQLLP